MPFTTSLFHVFDRCFNWLAVGVAVGTILAFHIPHKLATLPILGAIIFCVIFSFLALYKQKLWLACFWVVASFSILGVLGSHIQIQSNDTQSLARDVMIPKAEVTVLGVEDRRNGWRLTLQLDAAVMSKTGTNLLRAGEKVRVFRRSLDGFVIKDILGARLTLALSLQAIPGPVWPNGYDFARHAWFKKLAATGFSYGPMTLIAPAQPKSWQMQRWIQSMRAGLRDLLSLAELKDEALVKAIMVGEKGGITQSDFNAMRDSGLAHLLAISGLHMGMVAASCYGGLRLILALFPRFVIGIAINKWAAGLTIGFCFLFLLLTGASISTQRAFIMAALVMLAIMLDRRAFSLRLASMAALVILVFSPHQFFSIGFQLSFTAVFGLVAFYEVWRDRMAHRRELLRADKLGRSLRYLLLICLTTLIATLITAYPSAYHFGTLPVYGVFANLIAVPFMTLIVMPLVVITLVLFLLGINVDGMGLLWCIDHAMGAIIDFAHWITSWQGSTILIPAQPKAGLLAFFVGLVALCFCQGRWRWLALSAVIFMGLSGFTATKPVLMSSEDGQMLLFSDQDQRYIFSAGPRRRFQIEQWQRYWADRNSAQNIPNWFQGAVWRCDPSGCRTTHEQNRKDVVVIWDHSRLETLCFDNQIAILIAPLFPLNSKYCPMPKQIFDRFDLNAAGAITIAVANDRWQVTTTASYREGKPWAISGP